eukprot:9418661-Pyramimonas_sp.AAC.1
MIGASRHVNASDMVIRAAREFKCSVCDGGKQPLSARLAAPLTAASSRLLKMDVRAMRGWLGAMKVKWLDVLRASSAPQPMAPFFEPETGEVLRRRLCEHSIRPYGSPKVIRLDASKVNCGQRLMDD